MNSSSVAALVLCLIALISDSLVQGFASNRPRKRDSRMTSDGARQVSCQRSPFQSFEDSVCDQIMNAQDLGVIDPVGEIGQIDSCFVKLEDLTRFAFEEDAKKERHELAKKIHDNGGYIIVELGVEEAKVMDKLWECAHELFCTNNDANKALFRHQTLAREGRSSMAEAISGYRFIETTIRRKDGELSFIPAEIADIVEERNAETALEAFQLLSKIGSLVVTVSLMVFAGINNKAVGELMQTIPDDGTEIGFKNETSLSCSVLRICRYFAIGEAEEVEAKESLRSHTDWTLATLVPAAAVPGLEVWRQSSGSWIRPELSALAHWKDHSAELFSSSGYARVSWNSRYVVVMAGKWLEILTGGKIHSSIHRVICTREPRYSTPFFYRPRQQIPIHVQARFGERNADPAEEIGGGNAIAEMSSYLNEAYTQTPRH